MKKAPVKISERNTYVVFAHLDNEPVLLKKGNVCVKDPGFANLLASRLFVDQ